MPVEVAAPLAVLVSITVAVVIVLEDWHKVHLGSAWRLVLSTRFGIPLGLLLLTAVPGPAVKAVLAVVIIAYSAYCLARRTPLELHDDRLAWLFGVGAGGVGGGLGIEGAPLGGFRPPPPPARRAVPGDVAGVLPARERGRHGRLLAGGPVGAVRDPLLPAVLACRRGVDCSGAGGQPTPGGAFLHPVRPHRPQRDRGH